MILFLDTTTDNYHLALCSAQGRFLQNKKIVRTDRSGDAVFRMLRAWTKKQRPTACIVVTGPGRFSGIRHGIALANTLAFAWGIPVVGIAHTQGASAHTLLKQGIALLRGNPPSFVLPSYGKEPSITLK